MSINLVKAVAIVAVLPVMATIGCKSRGVLDANSEVLSIARVSPKAVEIARRGQADSVPYWSYAAFSKIPKENVYRDYGLSFPDESEFHNDGLPIGLIKTKKKLEVGGRLVDGIAITCELCHSTSLFGKIVVGVGNPFANVERLFNDLDKATGLPKRPPTFALNPPENSVVNGADHLSRLGLYIRNPDLSIASMVAWQVKTSGIVGDMKKEFDTVAYLKTPPWVTYAVKRSQRNVGFYADGGLNRNANVAAYTYMMTFTAEQDGSDLREALGRWKQSGPEFLLELVPPRYPFAIESVAADRGLKVFTSNCAECHGTYAKNVQDEFYLDQYPGVLVPVAGTATDPKRANISKSHVEASDKILGAIETGIKFTGGYVAPPLTAIWARAPFLHNGAVPTIWQLLNPNLRTGRYGLTADTNRESDYNQTDIGWAFVDLDRQPAAAGVLRTYDPNATDGLSNTGHEYGAGLTTTEKRDLLEFLKEL